MSKRMAKADLGAVLDALWDKFGGAEGLAQASFEQYDAAKDGSSAKLNMIRTLIEQIGELTARQAKGSAALAEVEDPADMAAIIQHLQSLPSDQNPLPTADRPAADDGGSQRPVGQDRPGGDSQEPARDEMAP
jgi:hypothetical protein